MTIEEIEWIQSDQTTCATCNHLTIFHINHCCEFCIVGGCMCSWEAYKPNG